MAFVGMMSTILRFFVWLPLGQLGESTVFYSLGFHNKLFMIRFPLGVFSRIFHGGHEGEN